MIWYNERIADNYTRTLIWYNECKTFIIIYLNALADTQNKVLLPAYRAIIP